MNGMAAQNGAFGLMGKALNDMEARKNNRTNRGDKALADLAKVTDRQLTGDIIKETKQNTFYNDFQNKFDTEVASMYNPDGSVIAGQEARAKRFSDGGFGDSINPNEISHMGRLSAGVDDAKRYSNDIYSNMLSAGLSPAQAEAQRKTQYDKWKTPEMTKGALQAQKIKSDQILKDKELFNKNALELFKTKESTGGYTDAAGNFVSTKTGDKNRFKDALKTKADFSSAFGFDPTSDIAGNIGGDKAFGVYTSFLNQGYSPAQMREAISNTSAEEFFGTDTEANATTKKAYAKVVQNYLDKGGMKAGAKPGDASATGKYGSGSYSGIKDKAGFQKYLNQGNTEFDAKTAALLNNGQPGKEAVLKSIFDWDSGAPKKKTAPVVNDKKKVKKPFKPLGDNPKVDRTDADLLKNKKSDDAAYDAMVKDASAKKDAKKKAEEKEILKSQAFDMYSDKSDAPDSKYSSGLLSGEVKNSDSYNAQRKLYKTQDSVKNLTDSQLQEIISVQEDRHGSGTRTSNFAQKELDSRSQNKNNPWWNQNYSLAGAGRDTTTNQNTRSGNVATGVRTGQPVLPNVPEPVIPNVNPIDASKQQFLAQQTRNAGQGMRLDSTSQVKQDKAVQRILNNSKMDDMDKRRALMDLDLTPGEVYRLVTQGYGQVLN